MEDRAEGWAQEPAEARRAIEGLDVQLQAEAAKSARSLEEGREKAATLAQEVATRETSWPRARSNIVKRSRKYAIAAPLWPANRRRDTRTPRPGWRNRPNRDRGRATQGRGIRGLLGNAAGARASRSTGQRASKGAARGRRSSGEKTAPRAGGWRRASRELTASAEQQRRALEEAQARSAALASELAGTTPR